MNNFPTLTLTQHEVAAKLWQHGEHDAYYNLMEYIKQGDAMSDNLHDAQALNDTLYRQLDEQLGDLFHALTHADYYKKLASLLMAPRSENEVLYDAPSGEEWLIAHWPNGTWCDWADRHEFNFMSDDYERHWVVTWLPSDGVPVKTMRVLT